ncbi:MAG TPA: IS30 family transposase [Segetibacter sp.]
MTKEYFQLTLEQRYQIESLKKAGLSQTAIAKIIGVDKSTVCREFKRNIPLRGSGAKLYVAERAQKKTDLRHYEKYKPIFFSTKMKQDAREMLTIKKYSPELISAQWVKDGKAGVSHETIYKWIWECKHTNRKENAKDKRLYLHLKHGRRRRKRGNYKDNRGLIRWRVSIEKRPQIVDKRKRLGDMEVDLIIGKNHKSGLLVTLDRSTLITTIDKINSKNPKHIKKLLMKRMQDNKDLKTITFDNDQAFSLHHEIAKELNVKTYFTRPYTSQDKGSIENRNGVIRRFYPKKTDFNEVTVDHVKKVEKLINNRPIRKFDYKSPNEVYLIKSTVALIA